MLEEVTKIDRLLSGKPMLTWVSYPGNDTSTFCFAYPQYIQQGNEFAHINSEIMPDRGTIFVSIQGGNTVRDISGKYGEVVVAMLNVDDEASILNRSYPDEEDYYYAMLNEHFTHSAIEFTRLDEHQFGKNLVQIIELEDEDISFEKPFDEPVDLALDVMEPVTQLVMVRQEKDAQLVYYGPFSAQRASSGGYELDAVTDFRKRIFEVDSNEIGDIAKVDRKFDNMGTAAQFIMRPTLIKLQNRPGSARVIDWVTDKELIEALADTLKNTPDLGMSTEDIRTAKKAIDNCVAMRAGLVLYDSRKERMKALLDEPAFWENKIDTILTAALTRPKVSEKLVDLALSESYFPRVKKLFVNSEAVQQQAEEERQRYYAEVEKAKKAAEEALKAKEKADRQLEESRNQIEAMRETALANIKGELGEVEAKRDAAKQELDHAQEELRILDNQVSAIVDKLDDNTDTLVRNLLERRVLSRICSDSPEGDVRTQGENLTTALRAAPIPREDEAEISDQDVIRILRDLIVNRAERDMDNAQIVNLLVCLMGSSITVFSGLPGTGKTTLANVLAGALGLTSSASSSRYLKIPVERGWTSHRDYIGYYNPLMKQLEASNSSVFEAIMALDAECRASSRADGTTENGVPYLLLLDEANLSVVENYWSPFLSNADDFLTHPSTLSMQGGNSLALPVCVRWIATVNYDHTTEALSERFLNRAWVINVEGDSLSLDDLLGSSGSCDFSDVQPFSYRKLMDTFGPKEEARIDDSGAKRLMASFFATCKEGGKPVSYRCQRAIARYVASAEPLMRELSASGGTHAVDFALAQRVLPSINGTGEDTRKLLTDLKAVSPLLVTTNRRIDHMLRAGDADGFYQFFA